MTGFVTLAVGSGDVIMSRNLYDPTGREAYIDAMKGIGILLLILSHSIQEESMLKTWIFSFHMPLFFWCSGWLFALRLPEKSGFRETLKSRILRKTLSILIPCVVFSLVLTAFFTMLQAAHDGVLDTGALCGYLRRIIELRGVESMWFLPVLLVAEILLFLIYAFFPMAVLYIAAAVGFAACFFINGHVPEGFAGTLVRAVPSFVYIAAGVASCRLWTTFVKREERAWAVYILCLLAGGGIALQNGFTSVALCEFGCVLLYYLSALLTLTGLVGLCRLLPMPQLVCFYGVNSIVVLCTNNIIIEIIRLVDYKLCGDFFLTHGMVGNFAFAIVITAVEFPLMIVGMKYFPVLFGRLKGNGKEKIRKET